MPILYVHGVNVRSDQGFLDIEPYLRRLVAPALAPDPDLVLIDDVYWGDLGVTFAFNGASRPHSRLLGMGGERGSVSNVEGAHAAAAFAHAFRDLPDTEVRGVATGGLISGGADGAPSRTPPLDLSRLEPDELSDLLARAIADSVSDVPLRVQLTLAADELARHDEIRAHLQSADSADAQLELLRRELDRLAPANAGVIGMGARQWLQGVCDRLGETVRRAKSLPAYAASLAFLEVRKPLNELISVFLGDVFVYLQNRGAGREPGDIQKRFLAKLRRAHEDKLRRGGEPLVVLSHSMGGQFVYDAVTHFLPADPAWQDVRIDFWCATASQVGFFEEAKLFQASDPQYKTGHPVPFPGRHLGLWWNVWDHNDAISFTVRDIIAGVDDEPYDSGMSVVAAHGGYLQRPSFFRRFAARLRDAKDRQWRST